MNLTAAGAIALAVFAYPLEGSAGFMDTPTRDMNEAIKEMQREMDGDSGGGQYPHSTPADMHSEPSFFDAPEYDLPPDFSDEPLITVENAANQALLQNLYAQMKLEWGGNYDPETVTVHEHDVTCDGKMDYIASHINSVYHNGTHFDILIATDHEERLRTDMLSMRFNMGLENNLCTELGQEPKAEIYYEEWPQGDIEDYVEMDTCAVGIRIVDGVCDSPIYFWSNEAQEGEARWVYVRN
ncbi:MAG: hypothetical protein KTR28_07980 [Micavibrio sp.]|nr:hypothetical protein [Micavibrio sp.]